MQGSGIHASRLPDGMATGSLPVSTPSLAKRWLGFLVVALAIVALGLSLALSLAAESGALPGCGSSSGCGQSASGPWSRYFGLPLAHASAVVYAIVAVLAARLTARPSGRWTSASLAMLVVLAVGVGFWTLGLQASRGRWCAYCVAIHSCGFLIASLLLVGPWDAPLGSARLPYHLAGGCLAGLVATVLLVAGQALEPHLRRNLGLAADEQASAPMRDVPLLGSPSAPHRIQLYYCYLCPKCRDVCRSLFQVEQRYRGQLAIALWPFPLDPACNPAYDSFNEEHPQSCEYSRLALAVWRLKPDSFAEFHQALISPPAMLLAADLLPPELARRHAEVLVGQAQLAATIKDLVAERTLERLAVVGQSAKQLEWVPVLLVGDQRLHGNLPVEQVSQTIESTFGIKPTDAVPAQGETR